MINLISIEMYKIFSKWRTYIGFLAIAVLVPIVQLALHLEGEHYINAITGRLQDTFLMSGNLLNGYLIGHLILNALFIHIPFLIVLVGGDVLAGEATAGTYRLLVTRPISRFKIVTSKFIAGAIYTNLLLLFLGIMSVILSVAIFGSGDLMVYDNKITIFAADDVLWRFALAYGYASISLMTVFSLSFLASSLVENAIGPIIATMAVLFTFMILSALDFQLLRELRPYMFVNYMYKWNEFFRYEIDYGEIYVSISVLLVHVFGLYGITLFLFKRKDILS